MIILPAYSTFLLQFYASFAFTLTLALLPAEAAYMAIQAHE